SFGGRRRRHRLAARGCAGGDRLRVARRDPVRSPRAGPGRAAPPAAARARGDDARAQVGRGRGRRRRRSRGAPCLGGVLAVSGVSITVDVDGAAGLPDGGAGYAHRLSRVSERTYGLGAGLTRILGVLDEFGARATFYVPGITAERHPDEIAALSRHE